MDNILIEKSRIDSWALSVARKFTTSGDKRLVVVGVGNSGYLIAKSIHERLCENGVRASCAQVDHIDERVFFIDLDRKTETSLEIPAAQLTDVDSFLIVDGVVRTGKTLAKVYEAFKAKFASHKVHTYAMAVCVDSQIIPSWFGIKYSKFSRIVFDQFSTASINSLLAQNTDALSPNEVVLRYPKSKGDDLQTTTPASMKRYTADDRFFDNETDAKRVYMLEIDKRPIAYIAFHIEDKTLWVDALAKCETSSPPYQSLHVGEVLLRSAELYGLANKCESVALWAIKNKESFYNRYHYRVKYPEKIVSIEGGSESYVHMTKEINIKSESLF